MKRTVLKVFLFKCFFYNLPKGDEKDLCMEERTLNRILSGLHASVSS